MKYDHTIIHEGKECNALEVIKKLNLCRTTYYNQRVKGLPAQDAFLHCLDLKEHITITQIAKNTQISRGVISRDLQNGLSQEEIVKIQREKKEMSLQTLSYLREIGLPLEYNSLTDFCNREQLNMIRVYKEIQKGMNLYGAVSNSLIIK